MVVPLRSVSPCGAYRSSKISPTGHVHVLSVSLLLVFVASCGSQTSYPTVSAFVETESVASPGDAADDPAIWVHPSDPERSLVLGTNKRKGLEVYDLEGKRVQSLDVGNLNNIDVRQNVAWGSRAVDIAVATNRSDQSLVLFFLERQTGFIDIEASERISLDLKEPYGVCLFASGSELFAFVNDKNGMFQQWQLAPNAESAIVRTFTVDSQPEGCVADDFTQTLYYGEEGKGVWKRDASPDSASEAQLIASVDDGALVADVEGMGIYRTSNNAGYLIVSSQGDDSFAFYELGDENRYVGSVRVAESSDGLIDEVTGTDGIDATATRLGSRFPDGMLVVQDDRNSAPNENQCFKLIDWRVVADSVNLQLISSD